MRLLAVLAMFVACLVYGFMPAKASMMADATMAISDTHAGHHDMKTAQTHAEPYSDPCPHRGGPAHGSFCAACLAIVPLPEIVREGRPPFSWPQPSPARELAAVSPAPAEPPPRF